MGCSGGKATGEKNDGKVAKQFYDMSEEEREKAKKKMEEQDKDLKEEKNENENPKLYEMYNWDELIKKLPTEKTDEGRKNRLKLWNKINEYGNGYVSFKRLSFQLDKYLQLPNVVKNKGPVKLAFKAACNKFARNGLKIEDNLIEWMEFRIFLVYLRQYFEYWVMFEKLDKSGDHQINFEEFKKAIPKMKEWGYELTDEEAEKEFKEINKNNEGTISFEDFCSFAIQRCLDFEDDDGFDDEELKNLK